MISLVIVVIVVCYFYSKYNKRTEASEGTKISDDLEDLREDVVSSKYSSSTDPKENASVDKTETPIHLHGYDATPGTKKKTEVVSRVK